MSGKINTLRRPRLYHIHGRILDPVTQRFASGSQRAPRCFCLSSVMTLTGAHNMFMPVEHCTSFYGR